jgi:hypothetical protein
MSLSYPVFRYARPVKLMGMLVVLVVALTTSACTGTAQVRQQALISQQRFNQSFQSAQQFGFTNSALQPITQQSNKLRKMQPPLSLIGNQPIDDYYRSLNKQYALLTSQLQNFVMKDRGHVRNHTQQQLQQTQTLIQQAAKKDVPTHQYTTHLTQLQHGLQQAQNFEDFAQVQSTLLNMQFTLHKSEATASVLHMLKDMIATSKESRLDTTTPVLQLAYQHDLQDFQKINSNDDLQKLDKNLNIHYRQANDAIIQAIPAVTSTRLAELDTHIQQLTEYHVEQAPYQAKLDADQKLVTNTMSIADYQHFLRQIKADLLTVQLEELHGEAKAIIDQFHQNRDKWSNSHLYYDPYDGMSYAVDTSYLDSNFGADAENQLQQATTMTDLKKVINDAKTLQFNHQLMEKDYADETPYDEVHQTDVMALKHYQLQKGPVIVISLSKQTLRLYQDGNLIRSFLVTTGRAERPSPPGVWPILNRLSPTIFKSSDAHNSPYWYPNTVIKNAILFHDGGYFIHDSWWRWTYGPGTEFPHQDATGDDKDSGNGSHGCVNLPPDEAAWLYYNTGWNTNVVVY